MSWVDVGSTLHRQRHRLAAAGLVVLASGGALWFAARRAIFSDDQAPASQSSMVLHQVRFPQTASVIRIAYNNWLSLEYPAAMAENETRTVKLEVRRTSYSSSNSAATGITSDASPVQFEPLDRSAKASLSSSGFDIAPGETIDKAQGTATPTVFAWTITPKGEGNREMLLDVSELLVKPQSGDTMTTTFTVNGKESARATDRPISIPIVVLTMWGMPRRIFEIISYVVGIGSFVLMYPLLHDFVRRKLGWNSDGSAPPSVTPPPGP